MGRELLDQLLVAGAGAGDHHVADGTGVRLRHVVVDRKPDLVGELRGRVLVVQYCRERPGEEARIAEGDGQVGHARQVAEHAGAFRRRRVARQHPHQGKGVEVDALRPQAGVLDRLDVGLDHVAPSGHQHDPHALVAMGVLLEGGDLVVEHGIVKGHGDRLGGLEADGRLAFVVVLDQRQVHEPHHDLLVGHTQAHVLWNPGHSHEFLERLAQAIGVGHLPVAHEPGGELHAGRLRYPIAIGLHGSQETAVDIEAYGVTGGVLAK